MTSTMPLAPSETVVRSQPIGEAHTYVDRSWTAEVGLRVVVAKDMLYTDP